MAASLGLKKVTANAELRNWRLVPTKDLTGVFLYGIHSRSRMLVNTSMIVERIANDLVRTASKAVIKLLFPAKMDEMKAMFSNDFAEAFTNGFPENWKTLVKNEIEKINKSSERDKVIAQVTSISIRQINTVRYTFTPTISI